MNRNLTQKNKNVKIKICGVFRDEDIVGINSLPIDCIGFIFAKSPRRVDFELAKNLKQKLNKNIKTAGVFVNEKIENIIKLYEAKIIDMAQLHGSEDEIYIKNLKNSTGLKVIKTVKPGITKVLPQNADMFLFDTPSKLLYGGTGKTFDWSLIPELDKPIILAGGLNCSNIENAIKTVRPYAVDINSGVETNGHKDLSKITQIVKLIRGIKYD